MWEEMIGSGMEEMLEIWHMMKEWRQMASCQIPPSYWESVAKVIRNKTDIYWINLPMGYPIPIVVTPTNILDKPPGEHKIMISARRLSTGRVGVP